MSIRAVILAAGEGTRMKSDMPKVLHPVAGRPIVGWMLDAVLASDVDDVTVVIGAGAERLRDYLPDSVSTVVQEPRNGTGHAVQAALEAMGDVSDDTVVVVPGDHPLFRAESLRAMLDDHGASGASCTLMTVRLPDPTGYGRVVRDGETVAAVVEHRDASDEQLGIDEVNLSTYAFDGTALQDVIGTLSPDNDQGELYLTDVVAMLAEGGGVRAVVAASPEDSEGINSLDQLAAADKAMRGRINRELMRSGVWMQDPERTYVDAGVVVEPGARIHADTHLHGSTTVKGGAVVGPQTYLEDSTVEAGARVWYSVVRGATIGPDADVGPYASLRPGSVLERGAKAGTFVETKQTIIGEGAKVPHLSYMGDATIGAGANIGAGSITCNYDGYEKHRTVVGPGAFIGSDTMLVAPVEIGERAVTGAGSVITKDVSAGSLAVERSAQKEIRGYADRRAARSAEDE